VAAAILVESEPAIIVFGTVTALSALNALVDAEHVAKVDALRE
jgi:hypothetical protein